MHVQRRGYAGTTGDPQGRRTRLRLAVTWPWPAQLTAALIRLQALAPG